MGAEIMYRTIKSYAHITNKYILRVWLRYWRILRYDSDNTSKKKSTNVTWLCYTWAQILLCDDSINTSAMKL
jgi:hypothetical protein